ncbi:aldo/keto reductase [Marivita geojedonensis]|uniref:Aldo/keto reductase n=1 Tax=Marivita geojedonensis TaxID=1123756 RepID=A0A1X4NAB4_9RHOB|nr:aldo/keto reductase [Marivita geojedonensis]OSQ43383.1 aldo/keto reductase [Marivita geojedonensis]PRY72163.1 aryl-alcohol dehydrogenase-like predicted oxidoreductase [Marivita geojedonensis]
MAISKRDFGRTGWSVSSIGFGAWAIGGSWGDVSEADAKNTLRSALETDVNFIDTADVYGDGRSESIIRDVLSEWQGQRPFVATKAGRRLDPHVADGYTPETIEAFVDRSLKNLGVDCIDLLQLHCPPTEVYYRPALFDGLSQLVEKGKIKFLGVSVEKVEEALKAIEYPNVASVQIIYNIFRQRPQELFFREARAKKIAVIVRVPLASGLLSGKMTKDTTFAADDHRSFNRHGEAFDVGETFAGVPYEVALEAVDQLRPLVPKNATMAQFALRWILMDDAVSVVIPGARNPSQAVSNSGADALADLDSETLSAVDSVYNNLIKKHVHNRW